MLNTMMENENTDFVFLFHHSILLVFSLSITVFNMMKLLVILFKMQLKKIIV